MTLSTKDENEVVRAKDQFRELFCWGMGVLSSGENATLYGGGTGLPYA